jgi:uncharacterized membrane protein (UPF0127 family)
MVISINNNKFNCKVVSSPSQIRDGMMGKTFDGFDGMFFIMPIDGKQSFWMKNCIVPLDIIFISKNIINDISPNCLPCDAGDCPSHKGEGGFVLEVPAGTCRSQGIKIGDIVDYN